MLRDEFKHLESRIGPGPPGEKPEQTLDRLRNQEATLRGEIKERQGKLEQLQIKINEFLKLHSKLEKEEILFLRRRRDQFLS